MPLDGTELEAFGNSPLAKLGAVERLLINEQQWCKGRLRDKDFRFCLAGAMQAVEARRLLTRLFYGRSAVEDTVIHQGQPLDLRLPAGSLAHEEDDRADRIFDQLTFDLLYHLFALRRVDFSRSPFDQRIDLGAAAGVIARDERQE